ncbi:MAG: 30S ribosomal protein S9 [Thermoplasmata archaeon]|nr:30S ribosomal protein S9 [Thermoplasmata archaeon]
MKPVVTSGKRKTAIARATVSKGDGTVRVNNMLLDHWGTNLARLKVMEPIELAGPKATMVDIDINVIGGGIMGQAYAMRTAIARGIVQYYNDDGLEETFRSFDRSLLVNDDRRKEAKKPLGRGARKKRQKSYR